MLRHFSASRKTDFYQVFLATFTPFCGQSVAFRIRSSKDLGGFGIFWHENTQGDGSAWPSGFAVSDSASVVGDAYNTSGSIFVTDVDGDGDNDVLSTCNNCGTFTVINRSGGPSASIGGFYGVVWHENLGKDELGVIDWDSHQVAPGTFSGYDYPGSIFAKDLDGDGDADIVVGTSNNLGFYNRIFWIENLHKQGGAPANWTARDLATGLPYANYVNETIIVTGGDIDNMGDTDIVASLPYSGSSYDRIVWYENDIITDKTLLWTSRTIAVGNSIEHEIVALAVGDFRGDGNAPDVVSSSYAGESGPYDGLAWHENSGTGVSWMGHVIDADSSVERTGVIPSDIDGDGDVDIVTDDDSYPRKIVWFSNTDGMGQNFVEKTVDQSSYNFYGFNVGDIDGDGRPDVISASFKYGGQGGDQAPGDGSDAGSSGNEGVHSTARSPGTGTRPTFSARGPWYPNTTLWTWREPISTVTATSIWWAPS